jgi:hypothetical protein
MENPSNTDLTIKAAVIRALNEWKEQNDGETGERFLEVWTDQINDLVDEAIREWEDAQDNEDAE